MITPLTTTTTIETITNHQSGQDNCRSKEKKRKKKRKSKKAIYFYVQYMYKIQEDNSLDFHTKTTFNFPLQLCHLQRRSPHSSGIEHVWLADVPKRQTRYNSATNSMAKVRTRTLRQFVLHSTISTSNDNEKGSTKEALVNSK